MPIVDSHAHATPGWFEPVESLVHQKDRHGVERAVLVQFNGQTDNGYQRSAVRRFPGRFASVVMVDTADPGAPERLMWGSDYPLVSAREGYGNALSLVRQQFAGLDPAQQDLIFGQVALRLFPVVR